MASEIKEEDFYVVKDGEWVHVKDLENFTLACCECGLTHDVVFSVTSGKEPRLFIKFTKNQEETDKIRKEENIKIGD